MGKVGLGERWWGERASGGRGLLITVTEEGGEAEREREWEKGEDDRGLTLCGEAWITPPDAELRTNEPL